MASSFELGRVHNVRFTASEVTDETVRLFLAWMDGVFVGTPEAMHEAVKQAMKQALAGKECPYA